MTAIRLLLADDHPVVRAGLRAVLESELDIVVVDEVATAESAIARAQTGDLDVVLMDLQFGTGLGGIEATGQIAGLATPPRVVVLTTYDTEADIIAAVEAGAAGYLLKDAPPEELIAAVRAALAEAEREPEGVPSPQPSPAGSWTGCGPRQRPSARGSCRC